MCVLACRGERREGATGASLHGERNDGSYPAPPFGLRGLPPRLARLFPRRFRIEVSRASNS